LLDDFGDEEENMGATSFPYDRFDQRADRSNGSDLRKWHFFAEGRESVEIKVRNYETERSKAGGA
jgi:hypothetical protein